MDEELRNYFDIPNAELDGEMKDRLSGEGAISLTPFSDLRNLLLDESLRREAGYARFENGDYLVSMYCPMPGVSKQMVEWWFWWHPQHSDRYRLWYPGEHFSISYAKKDRDYFQSPVYPGFRKNTQYPVERVGKIKMPLSIEFVDPVEFGFGQEDIDEAGNPLIVSGHVGAYKGLIRHTEMAHIFFEDGDGLYMISRFYIGKGLKNRLIRKAVLNDETARGMAIHCYIEYRNLAKKLPLLFQIFYLEK